MDFGFDRSRIGLDTDASLEPLTPAARVKLGKLPVQSSCRSGRMRVRRSGLADPRHERQLERGQCDLGFQLRIKTPSFPYHRVNLRVSAGPDSFTLSRGPVFRVHLSHREMLGDLTAF